MQTSQLTSFLVPEASIELKKVPFDIYLAATTYDPVTGEHDAEYIETIQVDVYGEEQFLTVESSIEIEATRVKAMFKRGTKDDLISLKKLIEHRLSHED